MKGQWNQSAVVAYLKNPYGIDPEPVMPCLSGLDRWWLQLPTALAIVLLQQIAVVEIAISQTPAPTPVPNPSRDPETQLLQRPILKVGSQGAEVTELQAVLQLLGFFTDIVNGVYGQSTVKAVSQFQQVAGLNADGVVGAATWNRLLPPTPPLTNAPEAIGTPEGFPTPTATRPAVTPNPTATAPTPTQSAPVPNNDDRPSSTQAAAKPTPAALPILRQGMQGTAVTGLQDRLRALGLLKSSADGVFGDETLAAVKSAQRRFSLEADGVVGPATWEALLR